MAAERNDDLDPNHGGIDSVEDTIIPSSSKLATFRRTLELWFRFCAPDRGTISCGVEDAAVFPSVAQNFGRAEI